MKTKHLAHVIFIIIAIINIYYTSTSDSFKHSSVLGAISIVTNFVIAFYSMFVTIEYLYYNWDKPIEFKRLTNFYNKLKHKINNINN